MKKIIPDENHLLKALTDSNDLITQDVGIHPVVQQKPVNPARSGHSRETSVTPPVNPIGCGNCEVNL